MNFEEFVDGDGDADLLTIGLFVFFVSLVVIVAALLVAAALF